MRGRPINELVGTFLTADADWLLLFSLGLLVELVLGGKKILGRLPSTDTLINLPFSFFKKRLDRANRSPGALKLRGLLTLVVLFPIAVYAGALLNTFMVMEPFGPPVAALFIARSINLRGMWEETVATAQKQNAGMHAALRTGNAQLVLNITRDWGANMVLFTLGGFALMLPFRLCCVALDGINPTSAAWPKAPFTRPFILLYDLMALPGALLMSLCFSLAPILVPGTKLGAARGPIAESTRHGGLRGILSRIIPLSIVAYGLGYAFRFDGSGSGKAKRWLGPKDGRARLESSDTRQTAMFLLASGAWMALVMIMMAMLILLAKN
ncbi:hypothetical protein [Kordiimonas sp.]|uniref:hypothetical protein n=1 Tax=Kordiimonas sp. TaxID=1970157 RepID=UPI003A8DD831